MYYLDDLDDDGPDDDGLDLDDDGLDLDDDGLEDDPDEALLGSEEGPDFLIYFFSPVLSLMFLYFSSSLL